MGGAEDRGGTGERGGGRQGFGGIKKEECVVEEDIDRQRRVKSNTTSGCFNVFQPREGHRRDARARIPAAIARTLCKHITQVQHKYTTSVWVFVLPSCLCAIDF